MLDLASILTQFRPLILWLLAAVFGLPWLTGCAPKDGDMAAYDERLNSLADFAYETGLEFEAEVIWGDAHAAGASWNLTGSHGTARVKGHPRNSSKTRKTDSQPSIFDAP